MIETDKVQYIAHLARLKLTADETKAFTVQLGAILDHIDQLNKVDTEGVEPTCFVAPQHDPLRNDTPSGSLPTDEVLKNGPSVKKGHFAVPKVINQ